MKVFTLKPNENWVVDRFVDEWNSANADIVTNDPRAADIIWACAGWCWNHIPQQLLTSKHVVCTVHHIDPLKFNEREFLLRDQFVDVYHVPCKKTAVQLGALTRKRVFIQPFWVNSRIWTRLDRLECRHKHSIPSDAFVVGSFQRDTEGSDLVSPKLSKGPDVFCDVVEAAAARRQNVTVMLAGWRRQYVMSRLTAAGIPYIYFELPKFEMLNELYNCLDVYVVGSRHEGGPQPVFECAATATPIISTRVGFAEELLSETGSTGDLGPFFTISDDDDVKDPGRADALVALKHCDVDRNYERVTDHFIPRGMGPFRRFFERTMTQ